MSSFFDQIFNLLITPPGNLIYHLVLVLSIAGALLSAINQWRINKYPQMRRMMLGLSLLLSAQVSMFIISALAWQGFIDPLSILPPLDRALTLFCLVWIAWLWAFPETSRYADGGAVLLSLFIVIGLTFGLMDWMLQLTTQSIFNASIQDTLWQVAAIGLIFSTGIFLFIRHPNSWGNGLTFFALAFLGHLVYLLVNQGNGNFPGLVRLMYMTAYPILLTLPKRFPTPLGAPTTVKQDIPITERRRYSIDLKTFQAILDLVADHHAAADPHITYSLTHAVAQAMLTDLCFLIHLSEDESQIVIAGGYDLIRDKPLEGASLDKEAAPMLWEAIKRGHTLNLPTSSTSIDLKALGNLLGLDDTGHLLAVPLLVSNKEPIGAILLLSPYSNRMWSVDDQNFLAALSASMVQFVQPKESGGYADLHERDIQGSLDKSEEQISDLKNQNKELQLQLEAMMKNSTQDHEQAEKLAALLIAQEESQQLIAHLQKENEKLLAAGLTTSEPGKVTNLEGELRLTLEEIAHLQNLLAEANIKIHELEMAPAGSTNNEQVTVLVSIAQDLRQPLSSIVGYTELLLGESVGILGALQRIFIERIKTSTERIGGLINDLIQFANDENTLAEVKPESVDLNQIIDNAINYTSNQLREKNLSMHLDFPMALSTIYADREALQQILTHLLQNAGAATPVDGAITLRVQLRREGSHEYILIQVSDTGGGIPAEEIPRVFSRMYRAENVLIQGVGDTGVGLSIAKTLAEAQGGRIWIESEPGVGATFTVFLPCTPPTDSGDDQEGKKS
jgi:signal transduction histidine kinase